MVTNPTHILSMVIFSAVFPRSCGKKKEKRKNWQSTQGPRLSKPWRIKNTTSWPHNIREKYICTRTITSAGRAVCLITEQRPYYHAKKMASVTATWRRFQELHHEISPALITRKTFRIVNRIDSAISVIFAPSKMVMIINILYFSIPRNPLATSA